jgi:hypothetical protein
MKYKNRFLQFGCILVLCAMWYGFISLIINIWNTSLFTVGGILSIFFVIGMSILLCIMSIILIIIIIEVGDWK